MAPPKDYTTQSNYAEVKEVARHYELDVDFGRNVIEGYAKVTAEALAPGGRLVLDTRGLSVSRVELLPGRQPLDFNLGQPHKASARLVALALGTALEIHLPSQLAAGEQVVVGVRYATSPDSSALQFLAPSMTAGGAHPYLFSQCQAIHARSMVPCQDTPAVKAPYTAAVRVPAALTALMSAVPQDAGAGAGEGLPGVDEGAAATEGERRTFYFTQKVPIPSYLIALAAGQLESREISPRTRVWSEPSVVDSAAYEFAETARFLDAGESIAGPYVWGRYDLLLLPPSFPYGGMENPCLTFVTPTLLAGDRRRGRGRGKGDCAALTNVVAHEIAHSWTGNLVTNASWADFWLNEGWTVFLERKILGRLQGEKALQFNASRGAMSLQEEVARIGPDHNFTRLVPDLSAGEDPDDAFSRVPYEKGFYFLYYLQGLVGGPSQFEPFVKDYLQHFAFKTLTSDDFKAFFTSYYADKAPDAVSKIDWDAWLYSPGMPPEKNEYDDSLAAAAKDLAVRWHTADVLGVGAEAPAGVGAGDIQGWGSDQALAT
ncbi:leukotriene-A4 hydrolase [Monoraphidium neglectum]|uniref:Leucine aminopeptidase n=1 Tax=Monoraphidium neglectum TaxID=145388 RepID=A0A0D2JV48_9CHLO|nr:leukotriene-A4 hydrolase [Monoraphidium neglectum]KIZ02668.1 leukotriene-A4 hydrolase [Monoraphidium neglectum]|eukprot:XP_013901687.1 leukotriene-A4 hydrolase [Monoraphidium neglectum]